MDKAIKKYPPPWNLAGTGFLFAFYPKKEKFIELSGMSFTDKKAYRGGLGAIIFANYSSSNVGPYSELLFIPGDFECNGQLYKRVTKIYVSSQSSVDNGRANWGIPKELAQFEWRKHGSHTSIKVNDGAKHIADISYSGVFVSFPIDSSFFPLSIVQDWEGKLLKTTPTAKGLGKFSTVEHFYINPIVFPGLESSAMFYMPVGISVESFSMVFPPPEHI
jgi:hypothetical protein